jgi:hypothetical protein
MEFKSNGLMSGFSEKDILSTMVSAPISSMNKKRNFSEMNKKEDFVNNCNMISVSNTMQMKNLTPMTKQNNTLNNNISSNENKLSENHAKIIPNPFIINNKSSKNGLVIPKNNNGFINSVNINRNNPLIRPQIPSFLLKK